MDITTLALVSALNGPMAHYEEKKLPPPKTKPIVIRRVVRVSAAEATRDSLTESTPSGASSGGTGYIMDGFNCVACVNQLTGRAQSGNAGTHIPSYSTPKVGAIMVFYPGEQGAGFAGHVGVVTGVNGDGTVNLAHCNWGGGQTTFQSTGKFY